MSERETQFTTIQVGEKRLPTTEGSFIKANKFLKMLRQKMQEHDKNFGGPSGLGNEIYNIVDSTIFQSELLKEYSQEIDKETLSKLQIRLEENARRIDVDIPEGLKPAILRILSGELLANSQSYGIKPKRMASFTIYHGVKNSETLMENTGEREFFEDNHSIINHAVVGSPKNAERFLKYVIKEYNRLKEEPEIKELFKDNQSVIKYAAVNYTKEPGPEAFLRYVITEFNRLRENPEFDEFFKNDPSIIKRAIISNPDPENHEAFLRWVMKKTNRLQEAPEFKRFFSPGIIKYAVVDHHSKPGPEAFLRNAIKEFKRLKEEPEFKEFFKDHHSLIIRAVIHHPEKPDRFLRGIKSRYNELCEQFSAQINARKLSKDDILDNIADRKKESAAAALEKIARNKKYVHEKINLLN